MSLFKKVTIVGVGLLGGSLGLAIKKKKIAQEVVGFFRHKDKINQALRLGIVDKGTGDFASAVKDSDLVILASPVSDIIKRLNDLKGLNTKTLITDIGSTKSEIARAARTLNFIGSHPLAGSEKSGSLYARADLFENSLCILTPRQKNTSLKKLTRFWNALGAKTILLSPQEHDRILAFSSHLPHIAAFALIKAIPDNTLVFAAGGLKDSTRIALSDPKIWHDIFSSNEKNLLKSITAFEKSLADIKKTLATKDSKSLSVFLAASQAKRKKLLKPRP